MHAARRPQGPTPPHGQLPGLRDPHSPASQLSCTPHRLHTAAINTQENPRATRAQGAVRVKSDPSRIRGKAGRHPTALRHQDPQSRACLEGPRSRECRRPAHTGDRGGEPQAGWQEKPQSSGPPDQNQGKGPRHGKDSSASQDFHPTPLKRGFFSAGAAGALPADSVALGMCARVSGSHWFCNVGVSVTEVLLGGVSNLGSPATEAGSGPRLAGGKGKF